MKCKDRVLWWPSWSNGRRITSLPKFFPRLKSHSKLCIPYPLHMFGLAGIIALFHFAQFHSLHSKDLQLRDYGLNKKTQFHFLQTPLGAFHSLHSEDLRSRDYRLNKITQFNFLQTPLAMNLNGRSFRSFKASSIEKQMIEHETQFHNLQSPSAVTGAFVLFKVQNL
jgi:hypothetical protein